LAHIGLLEEKKVDALLQLQAICGNRCFDRSDFDGVRVSESVQQIN
jgi:hypothetical protein